MNAAKRECMVTGKRIAMVTVCQELLSSFESLEFSYPNGSSLSRISGQVAIYNILARFQICNHYCEIWEIIPDLLSFFRLEFAKGLWRFESATFPRVTGSTQFLEGGSDEKLRAIFE
jgi:hypothetical protein